MVDFVFWIQHGIISLLMFVISEFPYLWQFTFPYIAFIHPVLSPENGKKIPTLGELSQIVFRRFDRNEHKFEEEYSLDLGLGGCVYILLEGKNWMSINTHLINLLNTNTS